jgi:hypothetical protein
VTVVDRVPAQKVAVGCAAQTRRASAYASGSENVVSKLLLCEVGVTYAIVIRVSKYAGSGSSDSAP